MRSVPCEVKTPKCFASLYNLTCSPSPRLPLTLRTWVAPRIRTSEHCAGIRTSTCGKIRLEPDIPFHSAQLTINSLDTSASGYAKAACERLPRELRDLVYEHLWSTINDPISTDTGPTIVSTTNEDLDTAITRVRHTGFGARKIVGDHFAREAFEWLYEHGILGYQIQLQYLGHYLVTGKNNLGLVPADCRLRSINVVIECPVPPHMPCSTDDEITGNFTPLLQLQLLDGFQITIHIVVRYSTDMHGHNLIAIHQRVREVAKAFAEKKTEVKFEYEVKVDYEVKYDNFARSIAPSSTPHHVWSFLTSKTFQYKQGLSVSAPYIFLRGLPSTSSIQIKGRDAEELLEAGAYTWVTYPNKRSA